MFRRLSTAVGISAMLAGMAFASDNTPISVPFVQTAPTIDGVVDEVWDKAARITDFTQIEPQEGVPATGTLETRLMTDGKTLYVLFVAASDYGDVTSKPALPDRQTASDRAMLTLGTAGNIDNGIITSTEQYVLEPNGSCTDFLNGDGGWNQPKRTAAKKGIHSWTGEMALPLSYMIHSSDSTQVWAFNLTMRRFKNADGVIETDDAFSKSVAEANDFPNYHGLIELASVPKTRAVKLLLSPAIATGEKTPFPETDITYDSGQTQMLLALKPSFLTAGQPVSIIIHSATEISREDPRKLFSGIDQAPMIQLFYSPRIDGDVSAAFRVRHQSGGLSLTAVDGLTPQKNIGYTLASFQLRPNSRLGYAFSHRGADGEKISFAQELFSQLRLFGQFRSNATFARTNPAFGQQDDEKSVDFGYNDLAGNSLIFFYQDVGKHFDPNPTGILGTVDRLRYRMSWVRTVRDVGAFQSVTVDGTALRADVHDGRSAGPLYSSSVGLLTRGNNYLNLLVDRWGDRVTLSDGTDLLYWADDIVLSSSSDSRKPIYGNLSLTHQHAYDFDAKIPIRVLGISGGMTYNLGNGSLWMTAVSNTEYDHSTLHDERRQLRLGGNIILPRNIGLEATVDHNTVDDKVIGTALVRWVPDPDQGITAGLRIDNGVQAYVTATFRVK